MIRKEEQIYYIVRAIISACPTKDELREAIKIIGNAEYRQEILNSLEGFLGKDTEYSADITFIPASHKKPKFSAERAELGFELYLGI